MFQNVHETEETAPNSDIQGCQYSSSSYHVPSRTADTRSPNSAQASGDDIPVNHNLHQSITNDLRCNISRFPLYSPDCAAFQPSDGWTHLAVQGELQDATSTPPRAVPSEISTDYKEQFATSKRFDSKELLIEWTRNISQNIGFEISTTHSDNKKSRVTLGCERSGKYRKNTKANQKEKQLRNPVTKKLGCPFKLKGNESDGKWKLEVVDGRHNHSIAKPLEGQFCFTRKFSKEEMSLVLDMSKTPKQVLKGLKGRDFEDPKVLIKRIYNARQRYKAKQRAQSSKNILA